MSRIKNKTLHEYIQIYEEYLEGVSKGESLPPTTNRIFGTLQAIITATPENEAHPNLDKHIGAYFTQVGIAIPGNILANLPANVIGQMLHCCDYSDFVGHKFDCIGWSLRMIEVRQRMKLLQNFAVNKIVLCWYNNLYYLPKK